MKISDSVVFREEDSIIFNQLNGSILFLNRTGFIIMQLISKGFEKQKLIDTFCNQFEVNKTTFKKDLNEFIDLIKEKNILTNE